VKSLLSLLFFLAASISAAQLRTVEKVVLPKTHQYILGFQVSNFYYQEPGLMNDSGYLYGLVFQYLNQRKPGMQFRVDGEFAMGTLNYVGHFMDGSPAQFNGERFRIFEVNATWARDTYQAPPMVFSPFYGLGYRSTFDNKDNESDYRRDYYYLYGTFGLQWRFRHSSKASSKIRAGLSPLFGGSNKTYLSDFDADFPDVTLPYTSGVAQKIAYEYTTLLANNRNLVAGISYTRWSVSASQIARTPIGNFVEPGNDTIITAINLSYLF
jgi:hypothetical protein